MVKCQGRTVIKCANGVGMQVDMTASAPVSSSLEDGVRVAQSSKEG